MTIEKHEVTSESGDLSPELVGWLKEFYQNASDCVKAWKEVKSLTQLRKYDGVSRDYYEAFHLVSNNYEVLSNALADLQNKPNTGDLLRKNIGIVLADMDKVHQILLVNDQSITAKLDSMRKRRDAQGFISKNKGRARNLMDKAAEVYVPLVERGVRAARSAKHFILTKGVRKVVPKPVRKTVTWFGDAMQDTQDFWRELTD